MMAVLRRVVGESENDGGARHHLCALQNGFGPRPTGKKSPSPTRVGFPSRSLPFLPMNNSLELVRDHPIPFIFLACVMFFIGVEYTIPMVHHSSPPFDLGFVLTGPLNRVLSARPTLNSALAALNTVFVVMQTAYIFWALLVEQRPRATISALFMFTCRGILGYCTQLPLPKEFLGSGMDFPVANVSFFLFFSGHVAGGLIASLDMRRVGRDELARVFDALNVLQGLRLLATRGHYTIDLAAGVGAGFLFDYFAGKYEEKTSKRKTSSTRGGNCCACDRR